MVGSGVLVACAIAGVVVRNPTAKATKANATDDFNKKVVILNMPTSFISKRIIEGIGLTLAKFFK